MPKFPSLISCVAFSSFVLTLLPSRLFAREAIDARIQLKNQIAAVQTPGSSGTATIVGYKNGVYTAITSNHVISGFGPSEELYAVSARDGTRYKIHSVYTPKKGVDLAVFEFNAPKGSFNLTPVNPLYDYNEVPPYAGKSAQYGVGKVWNVLFDGARGAGLSLPSNAVELPIYRFTSFELQERVRGNKDGYEFIYSESTVPGMSGGPIVGYMNTCFTSTKNASADGRPSWMPLSTWDKLSHTGKAMMAEDETTGSMASPEAFGFISLIAIHGRSEESSYGGRSGASLAVPVDMIADYLRQNAAKHGIPKGFSAINKLALNQYCQ